MKRLIVVCLALGLLCAASIAVAQDNMGQGSSAASTPKLSKVTGKISDDGKSFVADKDGKSWTIVNPDAVKGHEGHHVTLSAHVYPDKMEVHVMSLKMVKDKM